MMAGLGCIDIPGPGISDKDNAAQRSSCQQCHQPQAGDGITVTGLEEAHPWHPLTCVECHGGNPDDLTVAGAHVPERESPKFLKNLTALQLDEVDQDYLRFINPGDMRVVSETCGRCHAEAVEACTNSMMSHTTGEVTVARYRAGAQDTEYGIYGATPLVDLNFDPTIPTTVESMELFNPDPLQGARQDEYGSLQDHYMETACFRCHLGDFGENKFNGDFRSSGCSACHMLYEDDGLSRSADALIDHQRSPHPVKHQLTSAITVTQCTHCHYRGGRLGMSIQGFREGAGSGLEPPNIATLGRDIHGHDVNFYVTDEDTTNDFDETPPDIHFEKGMTCIDCHTLFDVHGDGHLYSDTPTAVEIECETCHGTIDERATMVTSMGRTMTNMEKDPEGKVWLTTKLDGVRRSVPQVVDSMAPSSSTYNAAAAEAHGRAESGFSHAEGLECYTCHAAWQPNCYGCHVTIDFTGTSRSLVTGDQCLGKASGSRKWVNTDDLVLMINQKGRVAPSIPAERFFLTAIDENGEVFIDSMPRPGQNGAPGMGQRAYNPHTSRKESPWSSCDRCHPNAEGSNLSQVDITAGFGSDRYLHTDGSGRVWQLDQIQTREYEPLVTVGHSLPIEMRPLPQDVVENMMGVIVESED